MVCAEAPELFVHAGSRSQSGPRSVRTAGSTLFVPCSMCLPAVHIQAGAAPPRRRSPSSRIVAELVALPPIGGPYAPLRASWDALACFDAFRRRHWCSLQVRLAHSHEESIYNLASQPACTSWRVPVHTILTAHG